MGKEREILVGKREKKSKNLESKKLEGRKGEEIEGVEKKAEGWIEKKGEKDRSLKK